MLVDQFLYKATIITDEEIEDVNSWIIDDVEAAGYYLIDIDEYFNEYNPMYKELLPYCIRCAVNDIHIDYDMIRAVYHIPNFMKLYKFENDGKYITLTFGMDSECSEEYIKVVRLTEGQYYEYINKEQYPYYVVYLEEIYAWQNNMKLYQEIRQYKDIEDCSFYLLDDDLIKHVLKYINHHVFDENLECDENEAFFYYEEDEIF